jgi:septum formation protein
LKLVLASRSPRRAELLQAAGLPFIVRSAEIDETPRERENPEDYVLRLAEEKACAVPCASEEIILAADTCVVLDGEILGKPINSSDAARMIDSLAGRRHEVLTGVCLRTGNRFERQCASTSVWFGPMRPEEIAQYVASGEPMDKAGAYGIQGLASRYIERVEGSYTNVVGLPVATVYRMLAAFGALSAK